MKDIQVNDGGRLDRVFALDVFQASPRGIVCPGAKAHGRLTATGDGMALVCGKCGVSRASAGVTEGA